MHGHDIPREAPVSPSRMRMAGRNGVDSPPMPRPTLSLETLRDVDVPVAASARLIGLPDTPCRTHEACAAGTRDMRTAASDGGRGIRKTADALRSAA
jgi:hypothetical protein